MAKKAPKEKVITLENILFNCRDILRAAKNAGSFFEKRDMMLTLVFLRFMGEKYETGLQKLREQLVADGLDPETRISSLHSLTMLHSPTEPTIFLLKPVGQPLSTLPLLV